jgi:hypothetical protein
MDPASRPAEIAKGTPQFAIMYPGKVDEKALWLGNKLVVIGLAEGSQAIHVDGLTRTRRRLSETDSLVGTVDNCRISFHNSC